MKKLLALFLALVLCFVMIPMGSVAMAEDASTDAVIEAGREVEVITANNGQSIEEIFDTPIDCSGSDGKIVVASEISGDENALHTNVFYYIWIYTENKTSARLEKPYNTNEAVFNFALADFGLTDEDLAKVTGYKLQFWIRGGYNADYYSFAITVPKAQAYVEPVVTETIAENVKIATGTGQGEAKTYKKTLPTPLDCSGSDGIIKISEKMGMNCEGFYYLTIHTKNKTSTKKMIHGWQKYTANTEFISEVSLADMGLTDEDLAYVTGYELEIYARYQTQDVYYTFTITVPKPATEVIATDTIAENVVIATGTGQGTLNTYEKIFSMPIDCSGSNGIIRITEKMSQAVQGYYYLTIYTQNKTSTQKMIHGWQSYVADTDLVTEVTLTDMGLTDDDLKLVTGYKIEAAARYQSTSANYTFTITVPKVIEPIVTNVIEAGASVTIGGWDDNTAKVLEKTFTTPIDCSGVNDVIQVTEKVSITQAGGYIFTLYANGKTATSNKKYTWSTTRTAGTTYTTEFTLEELGLTDDDLKLVTGYKIDAIGRSDGNATFTFTIKIPKKPIVKTETEVKSAYAGAHGQTFGTVSDTFDPAWDMSGSNGTLVLKYKASVPATMYLYNSYIYVNGVKIPLHDIYLNATDSYQKLVFNLSDYGLTDDDLKNVTGYIIQASSQGDGSDFIFQIVAPRIPTFDSEEFEDLPTVYDNGDLRILPNTFYDEVIEYYPNAVITNNGEAVDGGPVVTGMTIKLMNGDVEIDSARIVVYDDLDKDGSLMGSDLTVLRKYLLGSEELDDAQLSAIAHHGYTTVDIRNLIRMKKILAGDVVVGQVSVTD